VGPAEGTEAENWSIPGVRGGNEPGRRRQPLGAGSTRGLGSIHSRKCRCLVPLGAAPPLRLRVMFSSVTPCCAMTVWGWEGNGRSVRRWLAPSCCAGGRLGSDLVYLLLVPIPGSPHKAASHLFEDGSSHQSATVSPLVAACLRERTHCERHAALNPAAQPVSRFT
jgi:hypothetical protein